MKTDIASTRSLRRSSARVVYVAVVRVCVAGGLLIICLINMSSQDVPDAPHGSPPTTAYARAGYVAGSLVDEPLTPISTATPAPRPLATGTHELEWADKKLGRPAALAANGVLGAAAGTTKMVGWTVGDSNLHVRSGLRSLAAMHLRVSARVHHVAFYHPSLDSDIAAPQSSTTFGGGGGGGLSSSSHHGSSGGKKVLEGVRHAIGLERRGGGMEWSAEEAARLAGAVESESFRLSRDGIVEQHFARRRSSSRAGAGKASPSRNRTKNTLSSDRAPTSRSRPGAAATAAPAKEGRGARTSPSKDMMRASTNSPTDLERGADVAPDSAIAGGGGTIGAKPRQFVVASRIPQSAENNKRSGTAEPPEATLSQMLKKGKKGRSKEGDALTLATGQGSTISNEIDPMGRLLADHAAPVAFDPNSITGDGAALASLIKNTPSANVGRYLPEVACRIPSSSVCFHLRGDRRHVQSTQPFVVEAPHVIFGGGRDRLIRRVAADGNPLVDARRFEYLSNNELSMSQRTESLLCAGATVWVDVPKQPKKDTKTAADTAKNIGQAATKTAHDTKKGVKKILKLATPKRSKKKKIAGTAAGSDLAAAEGIGDGSSDPSERPSTDGSNVIAGVGGASTGAVDDTLPLGDVSTLDIPAGSEERVGSVTSSQLLEAPMPYILVLDDVLEFKVQEFPSNSTIATFPISVASILNNTDMEERLKNPRHPSELTVTLVQEPSIKEKKWGVEIKITFRCAEVRPDSPLAMEKPEQDDKGRWKQSSLDDRMKRMRIHLKNIGNPKKKIEKEIRAMEERELQEEEEREAAIIMAGIGKGYEQGAPTREIVKRQIFYDPEREQFRRKPRAFTSKNLNSGVIREVALISSNTTGPKTSTSKSAAAPLPDLQIPTEILSFDNNEMQKSEFPLVNVSNISADDEGPMQSTGKEQAAFALRPKQDNMRLPPLSMQAMRSQYGSARDLPTLEDEDSGPWSSTSREEGSQREEEKEEEKNDDLFVSAQTGTSTDAIPMSKLQRKKNNASVAFNSVVEEHSPIAADRFAENIDGPNQSKGVSFPKRDERDIFMSAVQRESNDLESESSVKFLVDRKQSRNETMDSLFSSETGNEAGDDALSPRSNATDSVTLSPSRANEIAREEGEERIRRQRERKRMSMQSVALMHLSLGGAATQQKNLLEDEMDLLYQIAEDLEEEDELRGTGRSNGRSRRSSNSSPEKKQQQLQQQMGGMREYGTSIRDKGERMLLEEYPGLMILLVVIFSVVTAKTIFALLFL